MSKIQGLPKQIPAKELPFKFEEKGTLTGHTYKGDFVAKVPGTREMSQIGIELAKLNGGVKFEDLDSGTAVLHNAIAYLRIVLVDAPEWFTDRDEGLDYGLNADDANIPIQIFSQAEQLVTDWRLNLMGKAREQEKSETTKRKQSDN